MFLPPLMRSRSSPPGCPLYSRSCSYISSTGRAVKTSFPIISSRKSVGLSPPVTAVQHSDAVPLLWGKIENKCKCEWQRRERLLQEGSLAGQVSCLGIPVRISRDSTLQSVFFHCLFFPLHLSVAFLISLCLAKLFFSLSFSNCFHTEKPKPTKQTTNWINCNRSEGADSDTGEAYTVGGMQLPKPCRALEDALGQLAWARVCPEGHKLLSHLSAWWRRFHMPPGSRNAAGRPCLRNCISPAVRRRALRQGWEEVSRRVFLAENWGFIDSCVWRVPFLWAEFPTKARWFSSWHAPTLPEGEETFFPTAFAAAPNTGDSRALLCVIATCEALHL